MRVDRIQDRRGAPTLDQSVEDCHRREEGRVTDRESDSDVHMKAGRSDSPSIVLIPLGVGD